MLQARTLIAVPNHKSVSRNRLKVSEHQRGTQSVQLYFCSLQHSKHMRCRCVHCPKCACFRTRKVFAEGWHQSILRIPVEVECRTTTENPQPCSQSWWQVAHYTYCEPPSQVQSRVEIAKSPYQCIGG